MKNHNTTTVSFWVSWNLPLSKLVVSLSLTTTAMASPLPVASPIPPSMTSSIRYKMLRLMMQAMLQRAEGRALAKFWQVVDDQNRPFVFAQSDNEITAVLGQAVGPAPPLPSAQRATEVCRVTPFLVDCYDSGLSLTLSLQDVRDFVCTLEGHVSNTLLPADYVEWSMEFLGHLRSGYLLPPPSSAESWTIAQAGQCLAHINYSKYHINQYLVDVVTDDSRFGAERKLENPETVLNSGLDDDNRCPKCGARATEDQAHIRGQDEGPTTNLRCTSQSCRHVEVFDSR